MLTPPLSPGVEPAREEDRETLRRLVASSELPLDGLDAHLESALVVRDGERVVGCVALEAYGEEALLRSLAVEPERRGGGLGVRLARAALEQARRRGARRVWLLTTTAEGFFRRLGFAVVPRDQLPAALGASEELRGACPDSATAMRLELEVSAPRH